MSDSGSRKSAVNAEMLVGVSAVVIGVCALAVSLYETSLMREEQRASVLPLVELARSYYLGNEETGQDSPRLSLHAENVGIGPARIVDFRVTVDGQAMGTWGNAVDALLRRDTSVTYGQSSINGRTIPAGRQVRMFDLRDTELTDEIVAEFERLDFEACFCSVFDECWVTRYSAYGASTPVESCARDADSFNE